MLFGRPLGSPGLMSPCRCQGFTSTVFAFWCLGGRSLHFLKGFESMLSLFIFFIFKTERIQDLEYLQVQHEYISPVFKEPAFD